MAIEQLIYTDCARGSGFDPKLTGYQVKACSAGLTPEQRAHLSSVCMHYGDTVYRFAPVAAHEHETQWRRTTESLDSVPDDVLARFPPIWSYDRLPDGVYALTRVRYVGLTHPPDRRLGNFFARTLVFEPGALRARDHNPLNLDGSGLFPASDRSGPAALLPLDDLGSGVATPDFEPVSRPGVRERLDLLVSALAAAAAGARPVLVCIEHWQEAVPLVRTLLGFLPPTARAQTTFCTYESDRSWGPVSRGRGESGGPAAGHQLIVVSPRKGRALDLRPDEYNSVFAVFNFVDGTFSDLGPPTPFGRCAAACAAHGGDRLARHHELAERLGAGLLPAGWDAVARWLELRPDAGGGDRAAALAAMGAFAIEPERAAFVLDQLFLAEVGRLAGENDALGLRHLMRPASDLQARRREPGAFEAEVLRLARAALSGGRGVVLTALLELCGATRAKATAELCSALPTEITVPSIEEARPLIERLLEGAAALGGDETAVRSVLIAVFGLAHRAGCCAPVWAGIGATWIVPRLADPWSANKSQFARQILEHNPPADSPDAYVTLSLALLRDADSDVRAHFERLPDLATACAAHPDSASASGAVARALNDRFKGKERLVALARLVEGARGSPCRATFFAAYRGAARALPHELDEIRRELSAAGLVHTVCSDLLDEVLPWTNRSPAALEHWWTSALARDAALLDAALREVAALLPAAPDIMGLADGLLGRSLADGGTGPGHSVLAAAVAAALPMTPSSDRWLDVLDRTLGPSHKLSPAIEIRLEVLGFVVVTARAAAAPNWTVAHFSFDDPAWKKARLLTDADKGQLRGWLQAGPLATGITTPEDARAFIALFEASGETSMEQIGRIADGLARDRDPVTRVLTAAAFVRCHLGSTDSTARSAQLLRALVETWDRDVRQLLEQHLSFGFGLDRQAVQPRLEALSREAGLTLSSRAAAEEDSVESDRAASNPGDGFFKQLGRFFGGRPRQDTRKDGPR
jgi:hypothetical protein